MGVYVRLVDYSSQQAKEEVFLSGKNRYVADSTNFTKIPGMPIAYWVSDKLILIFQNNQCLEKIAAPRQGVKTLDNDRFLKFWFEPIFNQISFESKSENDAIYSNRKWFPYNKGGEYRRWYGNNDFVVNWHNNGHEMKELAVKKYGCVTRTITNIPYFYKEGLTWSALTSGNVSLRYFPSGYLFDSKGSSMFFSNKNYIYYVLSLINSKVIAPFLKVLAPTLDFNIGPMNKIPVIYDKYYLEEINEFAVRNITLSKNDWDSYETSWDFQKHPLI